MKLIAKNRIAFVLVLILVLAGFLRLYNFPYRYSLGEETVRDAVIGIEGARELQLPLTGAFSSLGPFTFGPLYAYQLTMATLILRSVYAPWIYLTIISILYVFVMYKVGERLFGKPFGLLVSFLCAISPAQIISATHLTSHNTTNIFAALALWLFLTLMDKQKSHWWNFLLGVVIGTGMNLHYQMVGLLILPVILAIKQKRFIVLLTAFLGVAATFLPLLIFELNNHWFNTRNMIDFLLYGRKRIYVPNRWLFYLRDFWPGFWADALGVPTLFGGLIMAAFAALAAILWFRKKLNKQFFLLILSFLVNFVLLRYYFGERFYGYLNFVRPYVFIFTAYFVYYVWKQKKYIGKVCALGIFILLTLYPALKLPAETIKDPFSMGMYALLSDVRNKAPGKNFVIYGCPTTYSSGYNGELLSAAFIDDLYQKSNQPTLPIGLINKKCILSHNLQKALLITKGPADVINLSSFNRNELLGEGWKEITFQSIYNSYARWWFEIKP